MVECPICHVANEDMARFCAECGQRLVRPLPAAQAAVSDSQSPAQSNSQKLHSPLLGADLTETPSPPDAGSWLNSERQSGSSSTFGLHSPLLGTDDPGVRTSSKPGSTSLGLHSPLLGGIDPGLDKTIDPPPAGAGRKHLHSPLLGGDEDIDLYEQPRSPSGRHHLRSPLLGGEDQSASSIASGRTGGLHSPILGGGKRAFPSGSSYDEPEEDDPNVLRSPLLAAKLPLHEKTELDQGLEIKPDKSLSAQANAGASESSHTPVQNKIETSPANPQAEMPRISPIQQPARSSVSSEPAAGMPLKQALAGNQAVNSSFAAPAISMPKVEPAGQLSASRPNESIEFASKPSRSKLLENNLTPASNQPIHANAKAGFLKFLAIPLALAFILQLPADLALFNAGQLISAQGMVHISELIVIICLAIICASSGKPGND